MHLFTCFGQITTRRRELKIPLTSKLHIISISIAAVAGYGENGQCSLICHVQPCGNEEANKHIHKSKIKLPIWRWLIFIGVCCIFICPRRNAFYASMELILSFQLLSACLRTLRRRTRVAQFNYLGNTSQFGK